MKNIQLWLKGLAAAVLGGAIASATQAAASGSFKPAKLKTAALTGAALTLGAYLTKSPMADNEPARLLDNADLNRQ